MSDEDHIIYPDSNSERAGLSPHTVRWTLKQVLGKAGVRRQAELVRKLLGDVGGIYR
ncbi:MAG: helix-turn-helix transcriptional regulator [Gammaproteobacteria bacterium]